MPNKKINKKKLNTKGAVKKGLAAFLASTIGLGSGAALIASFDSVPVSASGDSKLRYMNDNNTLYQSRIMMDGNNFLKTGFWMNAVLTESNPATTPATYDATLKFTIPGYDMSNLKFFVMDKNPLNGNSVKEYTLSSSELNPTPSIYLAGLKQGSYDVHVYNGSLAGENFVCKAEFVVTSNTFTTSDKVDLVDGSGAPIKINGETQQLTYWKASDKTGAYQTAMSLPYSLIPYNAQTVKVVFIASDRNGEPVNIDQTLYDYVWYYAGYYNYFPDANWGIDSSVTYEAHFYRDEVKEGNFICKATGITLS